MNTVTPEQVGLSSERLGRIRPVIQRYVDEGKYAGVITLVARHGKVAYLDCVGMMDRDAGKPMKEDTIFRIYSMTKPITSVALLMLYEEGRLRLNSPVADFIPGFANVKVYAEPLAELERPVTIRNLLTHTAGLSYDAEDGDPVGVLYHKADIWADDPLLADFVARILRLPLAHQPGTIFRYSVALDVVGYLIEIISGMSLDRFFRERIFEPLGMVDTGFYAPVEKHERLATLYHWENGLVEKPDILGVHGAQADRFLSGGAGLVSTMSDYYRFTQMLLNGGELDGTRLLGRKTVELMSSNHLTPEIIRASGDALWPGHGFGLGVARMMEVPRYGESGSVGMYTWGGAASTGFWIDPREDLIAILMTQLIPYGTFPSIDDFHTLTYQALVD